jgi:hypothetical protein
LLFLGAPRLWIALSEQFFQRIPGPPARFHHEAAAFDRDANLGAGLQVQDIEQRGRDG